MPLLAIHHHHHGPVEADRVDAGAGADLAVEVERLRVQTQHTDAKASMLLVAVGVAAAAASSGLPRLAGAGLVMGWVALGLTAVALCPLGLVAWPQASRRPRTAEMIAAAARSRALDPGLAVTALAAEAAALEGIVDAKWRRIRLALICLAAAGAAAVAAVVCGLLAVF